VLAHEKDMRAQGKENLRKGILRRSTLEHVHPIVEKNPTLEERVQILRRSSATDIRRNTTQMWRQLLVLLQQAAHGEGPHDQPHKAWKQMLMLLQNEPEVVVRWLERCVDNFNRRSFRERARCLDVLVAADLKSANLAAQRVIVNVLASKREPVEMQEYTLGSLASVGLPSPKLVEELARVAWRAGKRHYAHALGICVFEYDHIYFQYVHGLCSHISPPGVPSQGEFCAKP